MFLPFKIALRFLKSAKGQTILITIGIAIGVSVQLFIGLLIQGLQASLVDKIVGSTSHITISSTSADKNIIDYDGIIQTVSSLDGIKVVSASLDKPAFIVVEGVGDQNDSFENILVRGLTLDKADYIYKFTDSFLDKSTMRMPSSPKEVIVGKDFCDNFGYTIGSQFNISYFITVGSDKPPLKELVTITGIFDLKVASLNKTWVVTDIATVQEIFETDVVASSIEIQLLDVFASDTILQEVTANLPQSSTLSVVDWKAQNESLLSGLNGQTISSLMIQVFVVISVVLSIASVLIISVIQRQKQIGILKAMGIKDSYSSIIFLTQGFILGLMGAIVGLLLGIGLIVAFTSFALNPDGTPLIPMKLDPGFIALSGAIAIVASTLASLLPAAKSKKLDPIEVIRNG